MTRRFFHIGTIPELEYLEYQLASINWKLNLLLGMEHQQMGAIEDIAAEVEPLTDAVASAVAVMDSLAAQLEAALATEDPAAVQEVIDDIRANRESLAAAIVAHTAPEEPEEPPAG